MLGRLFLLFLGASWGLAKWVDVYLAEAACLLVVEGVLVDHGIFFLMAVLMP
jgi:hypothetical protein